MQQFWKSGLIREYTLVRTYFPYIFLLEFVFFIIHGIEKVGKIIKMITGGTSGDLPEGKGSIEFFDEVLQIT